MLACVAERWTPGVGDPTVWGWVTVLVYLGAGSLCALTGRGAAGRERAFWWGAGGLLVLLAFNKQLDLQSALTAAARCEALASGWYADRRGVQRGFVGLVAIGAAGAACVAAFSMRGILARVWPALLGLTVLLGFVAVRAASFHWVDALLPIDRFGVTLNAAWEVGALVLIGLGAARRLHRATPARRRF